MLQYIIVIIIVGLATIFLVSSLAKKASKGGCSCGENSDKNCTNDTECHCEGCPLNGKCGKK